MKKILILTCAVCALFLTSCGPKNETTATTDEDSVAVDTEATIADLTDALNAKDGAGLTAKIDAIKDKIQEYIDEGKINTAKKYVDAVKDFLSERQAEIEAISPAVAEKAMNAVSTVEGLVNSATDIAAATAGDAKEAFEEEVYDTEEAAEAKIDEVKEKADQKVEEVKEKANQKVDEAKEKANQKINDAVDNAADKLKKGLSL